MDTCKTKLPTGAVSNNNQLDIVVLISDPHDGVATQHLSAIVSYLFPYMGKCALLRIIVLISDLLQQRVIPITECNSKLFIVSFLFPYLEKYVLLCQYDKVLINFFSIPQVNPPDDIMTALLQVNKTLALEDSIITQLQESRDVPQLAGYVSMYGSIVNEATRLSMDSIGNTSIANMTANETQLILDEASFRMDVSSVLYFPGENFWEQNIYPRQFLFTQGNFIVVEENLGGENFLEKS